MRKFLWILAIVGAIGGVIGAVAAPVLAAYWLSCGVIALAVFGWMAEMLAATSRTAEAMERAALRLGQGTTAVERRAFEPSIPPKAAPPVSATTTAGTAKVCPKCYAMATAGATACKRCGAPLAAGDGFPTVDDIVRETLARRAKETEV